MRETKNINERKVVKTKARMSERRGFFNSLSTEFFFNFIGIKYVNKI